MYNTKHLNKTHLCTIRSGTGNLIMTDLKTYKIVLAEDDDDDSLMFQEAIQRLESVHTLKMIRDGEKLMTYLTRLAQEELPDFIFMDLHMPGKNGIQCVRQIRANKLFNEIPIIMFSDSGRPPDMEASSDYGANMFMAKTANIADLTGILKHLISPDGLALLQKRKSSPLSEWIS